MTNILSAIEQGSAAVPTLLKRLESLQEEHQALEMELADVKKDAPIVPRISEAVILDNVQRLDAIIQDTTATNKEKRLAIRYFVRQLRFLPESSEVEVYFWPNPTDDKERLRLVEKDKKKKVKIHPLL